MFMFYNKLFCCYRSRQPNSKRVLDQQLDLFWYLTINNFIIPYLKFYFCTYKVKLKVYFISTQLSFQTDLKANALLYVMMKFMS